MFKKLIMSLTLVLVMSVVSFANQTVLTVRSATVQLEQAESDYNKNNLVQAHALIKNLREKLSKTTELHAQLYSALKDNENARSTASKERELTIEFGKLRDRANFLAGKISRKQGNDMEAVKHFVQVVSSQRTTELGKQAYGQLKEIGFSPYLSLKEQY